jgi:chromosomal replication initiator protein
MRRLERKAPHHDLNRIIRVVAHAARLTPLEILSHRRAARLAKARQAAMWLARTGGHSYPEIARAFDRDHTTILYAVSRTEQRMAEDARFAAWVRSLEAGVGR